MFVPFLAFYNSAGTICGMTYRVFDGTKPVAVAQPAAPLRANQSLVFPASFTPVKKHTYTITVTRERPERPHRDGRRAAEGDLSARGPAGSGRRDRHLPDEPQDDRDGADRRGDADRREQQPGRRRHRRGADQHEADEPCGDDEHGHGQRLPDDERALFADAAVARDRPRRELGGEEQRTRRRTAAQPSTTEW